MFFLFCFCFTFIVYHGFPRQFFQVHKIDLSSCAYLFLVYSRVKSLRKILESMSCCHAWHGRRIYCIHIAVAWHWQPFAKFSSALSWRVCSKSIELIQKRERRADTCGEVTRITPWEIDYFILRLYNL